MISRSLAITAVALLAVALASMFVAVELGGRVGINCGAVFCVDEPLRKDIFSVYWINPRATWATRSAEAVLGRMQRGLGWHIEAVSIPLIWPAFVCGLLAWTNRPRRAPGRCACGYNLTGNTSGTCPECGRFVSVRSPEIPPVPRPTPDKPHDG